MSGPKESNDATFKLGELVNLSRCPSRKLRRLAKKCRQRIANGTTIAEACKHLGNMTCSAKFNGSSVNMTDVALLEKEVCEQFGEADCALFEKEGLCAWSEVVPSPEADTSPERAFDGEKIQNAVGVGGIVVFVSMMVCYTFCICSCCLSMTGFCPWGNTNTILDEFDCSLRTLGYVGLHEDDDLALELLMRCEARYMLLLPLLPWAALQWTTCESGTPWPVYVIYGATLLRSKIIELSVLRKLKVGMLFYFYMVLGCFEHFDGF